MKLESIRVVLVGTSHPGNVGATARAMKTMGLSRLYLVSPQTALDNRAYEMAAGADDIYQHAVIIDTLSQALNGCQLILATSARPREIDLPGLSPRESAALVSSHADDTEVALVFGNERTGLSNDELLHCHYHVHIASDPQFSSLNLAQSVQIMAYEMRMQWLHTSAEVMTSRTVMPATAESVEQFYSHLREVLVEIDFLKPSNPRKLLQKLRRMFNRTQLEPLEINILRGILTQIQVSLKRHNT